MKAIKQTERKTIVFDYHRSQAVKREYAPQALFGLLAEDLSDPSHFLEIDLDDEFFRTLEIEVELMTALQTFGLHSVAVSLDYGDPSDPRSFRHTDLVFDAGDQAAKRWVVPIGPSFDLGYRPRIEYHFDPGSDWAGERNERVIEAGRTEDRTLQLDPTRYFGFIDVEVRPERLPADDVVSVEVELRHQSSTGWQTARRFVVTPNNPPQQWRVRTAAADELSYQVTKTYHLVDGATITIGPESSDASTVVVTSPFATELGRHVTFATSPGLYQSAIIDVDYVDDGSGYTVERRASVGSDMSAVPIRFGIIDPSVRETSTQVTLFGDNGSVVQGPPHVGAGEFLMVSDDGSIREA